MSQFSQCHVMAKPSSSVCNLDCTYCFYLEKENLYPERKAQWKMSEETLELYVKQYIEAHQADEIEFTWQGGEPTLLGLDFYKKALEFQTRYQREGQRIRNAFQTNGLLIDEEWAAFFKANNFLIGISIDGPAHLHDHYRVSRSGKPSHHKVVAAINILKKHGVDFNTLTVLNSENVKYPEEVYHYLVSLGSQYLQFIPIIERKAKAPTEDGLFLITPEYSHDAQVTEWSVTPKSYGRFLTEIFDIWVKKDVGRIFVNTFDSTLAAWCNAPVGTCVHAENCGRAFVLEANGDLYNCDHFVYPEYKLGNIHQESIHQMNQSDQATTFGLNKKALLTKQCQHCIYRFACNGDCPKHRFAVSSDGQPGQSYLCKGYFHFFNHTAQAMQTMKELLQRGRPASDIIYLQFQQQMMSKTLSGGRNAPCPCGSGKKSKRCCQ